MDKTETAWVAGIIEGEGCLYSGRGRYELSVSMVDRDVIERLHETTGVGRVYLYDRTGARKTVNASDQWKWRVGRRDEIKAVIDAVLPLMCSRRAAKMREFLDWHEER